MQVEVSSRTESVRYNLRDREKRTAINVARMYEFMTEREWLGSRYIGEKRVTNYLSDTDFSPKDSDATSLRLTAVVEAPSIGNYAG